MVLALGLGALCVLGGFAPWVYGRLRLERLLSRLEETAALARQLPFDVPLERIQEGYYALLVRVHPEQRARAAAGDDRARAHCQTFVALGASLRIRAE